MFIMNFYIKETSEITYIREIREYIIHTPIEIL